MNESIQCLEDAICWKCIEKQRNDEHKIQNGNDSQGEKEGCRMSETYVIKCRAARAARAARAP